VKLHHKMDILKRWNTVLFTQSYVTHSCSFWRPWAMD